MRIFSSAMTAALIARMTQPGFLVSIAFASGTLYLGSRGTVIVDGHTYTGSDLEVSGLAADARGEQKGTLKIGNTDGAIGVLILSEANADWAITVSVYDAAATANGDPVQYFSGTGNGAGADERWATIELTSAKTSTQLIPAEYITAEQGFSWLPPAGMRIETPTDVYTLEPSRG